MRKATCPVSEHYDPRQLVDAPEHHPYSRAMGMLTWSTWDHTIRPLDQRIEEFVATFPPADPTRFSSGGNLTRRKDETFAPGTSESRLDRFQAADWRPGSIHELLARYGLKVVDGPPVEVRAFVPRALRETTQTRNFKLRLLHGGVDVEPSDMDAAKAEFLDKQEATRAAQDVREALKKMHDELSDDRATPKG